MRGVGGLPSGITFGGFPVTRNAEIDPGDNDPPPKMTQGIMTPPPKMTQGVMTPPTPLITFNSILEQGRKVLA